MWAYWESAWVGKLRRHPLHVPQAGLQAGLDGRGQQPEQGHGQGTRELVVSRCVSGDGGRDDADVPVTDVEGEGGGSAHGARGDDPTASGEGLVAVVA